MEEKTYSFFGRDQAEAVEKAAAAFGPHFAIRECRRQRRSARRGLLGGLLGGRDTENDVVVELVVAPPADGKGTPGNSSPANAPATTGAAGAPSGAVADAVPVATMPPGALPVLRAYQTPKLDPQGPAVGSVIVETKPRTASPSTASAASARLARAAERGLRETDPGAVIAPSKAASTISERMDALEESMTRWRARDEEQFREIRKLLLWQAQGALPGVGESWLDGYSRLVEGGLAPERARRLVEECAARLGRPTDVDECLACLAEALARILSVAPPPETSPGAGADADGPRVLAFVGPPGQGKSTVVQKAAFSLYRRGVSRLMIVDLNMDHYHPHSATASCARTLDIRHRVVATLDQARGVMRRSTGGRAEDGAGGGDGIGADVVLVDTTGHTPREPNSLPRLAQMLTALRVRETHLVLGADLDIRAARAAMTEFGPLRADRWVLTRMDCASRYPLLAEGGAGSGGAGGGWTNLSTGASPASGWLPAEAEHMAWLLLGVGV